MNNLIEILFNNIIVYKIIILVVYFWVFFYVVYNLNLVLGNVFLVFLNILIILLILKLKFEILNFLLGEGFISKGEVVVIVGMFVVLLRFFVEEFNGLMILGDCEVLICLLVV